MVKEKIIIIVGPTAVGKTSLSLELAETINGEIISGDSMQVYKTLDIGTAKATQEERNRVKHYLIDEVEPNEPYTVSDFKEKATKDIQDILGKNKVPIIVGGTGLYIESLLYDVSHGGEAAPDLAYREKMEQLALDDGNLAVWEKLESVDPEAAEMIHPNNLRRVIRALEVFQTTGVLFSTLQKEKTDKEPLFDAFIIGLTTDREILYKRINQRVEEMVENGLMEEAEQLIQTVPEDAQSVKGIGYKEWIPYFQKRCSLEQVTDSIKQNSRRYAKRQLTWFRNRTKIDSWWNLVEEPEKMDQIKSELKLFLRM
ncbi:tRNA (adenosine(37)-N6)-dimethylallyltransferase MiaA [Marinilactibacillus sp. XAAS-LB27]|uniref:tRNA (adenosine(37)-N6)-dimethylallyltransferase MiaA n=1 Tax=Marinilactibacillus sp. XAAS-LB27 TaxID=3114538 RepID=UPI002E191527|nr:tRNA (adenosine(37)-N6)-dimethylallyltransferase MiaA [Marinilactibacillus sp. XAAS-LB27]